MDMYVVVAVQLLSHVRLFVTPWIAAHQASVSFISWSLLKLMPIKSVMHPAISSSVIPFSSCPQLFPAPILWPPDARSQLIGKDSDAGKDWRQEDLYEILVLAVTYVILIPAKFAHISGLIQTSMWKYFV